MSVLSRLSTIPRISSPIVSGYHVMTNTLVRPDILCIQNFDYFRKTW